VLFVEPGKKPPAIRAEIKYTGAGRLRGRWEIVKPGDPLPSERDLLPESSLPVEERGAQARFAQLARFNVFLPSGGRYTLQGPDPSRLPVNAPGQYLILLRIEASDDGVNSSNLAAVGACASVVAKRRGSGVPNASAALRGGRWRQHAERPFGGSRSILASSCPKTVQRCLRIRRRNSPGRNCLKPSCTG